jgi:hypothetical protein
VHIALIGMSNIGKTYWSQKLAAQYGYTRIDCDDLVEARLGAELTRIGYHGIHDVARWMGQPYEPRYKETSVKYLDCEKQVMEEGLQRLRQTSTTTPLVVDTTGSVIYTGDGICAELKKLARVVYFEASPEHTAKMLELYRSEPKPVIWGDAFAQNEGETVEQAIGRCFAGLLMFRAARYRRMADIIIPYDQHKQSDRDPLQLLGLGV